MRPIKLKTFENKGGIPVLNSIQKKKGKELLQSNKNTNI